jgi:hypothetical protein
LPAVPVPLEKQVVSQLSEAGVKIRRSREDDYTESSGFSLEKYHEIDGELSYPEPMSKQCRSCGLNNYMAADSCKRFSTLLLEGNVVLHQNNKISQMFYKEKAIFFSFWIIVVGLFCI